MQSVVESEVAAAPDDVQELSPAAMAAEARGKRQILAELKRLDQELKFLEEELEELEKTENPAICQELLQNIDTKPDPLLPVLNGPANALWDRWFEGPQDSQDCGCWIL